jgi:hypothetical protein
VPLRGTSFAANNHYIARIAWACPRYEPTALDDIPARPLVKPEQQGSSDVDSCQPQG